MTRDEYIEKIKALGFEYVTWSGGGKERASMYCRNKEDANATVWLYQDRAYLCSPMQHGKDAAETIFDN